LSLVKLPFATIYRNFCCPSVQTSMAVGQVVVFRSVRIAFWTFRKIATYARHIGTWTFGRLVKRRLVAKVVLTRKVYSPELLKPAALVSLGVGQVGDANGL